MKFSLNFANTIKVSLILVFIRAYLIIFSNEPFGCSWRLYHQRRSRQRSCQSKPSFPWKIFFNSQKRLKHLFLNVIKKPWTISEKVLRIILIGCLNQKDDLKTGLDLLRKAEKVLFDEYKHTRNEVMYRLIGITLNNLGCYYKR